MLVRKTAFVEIIAKKVEIIATFAVFETYLN